MPSAESITLTVGPNGEGACVEWAPEALRALAGAAEPAPAWRLDGELDWDAIDSLRVVSAAFEDGRLLAVVAVRPTGAAGHDEQHLRGVLIEPEGEVFELAEALLSTEYDAAGAPARIGLELYTDPDAVPLRVAADRERPGTETEPGRTAIPMVFRLEGARGGGLLELVTRR
jgi:hypothetical protein